MMATCTSMCHPCLHKHCKLHMHLQKAQVSLDDAKAHQASDCHHKVIPCPSWTGILGTLNDLELSHCAMMLKPSWRLLKCSKDLKRTSFNLSLEQQTTTRNPDQMSTCPWFIGYSDICCKDSWMHRNAPIPIWQLYSRSAALTSLSSKPCSQMLATSMCMFPCAPHAHKHCKSHMSF